MAGIAGIVGSRSTIVDIEEIVKTLSFTGREEVHSCSQNSLKVVSIAHKSEAEKCSRYYEDEDLCILIDGEIVDIRTDAGCVSIQENIPRKIADLYSAEGIRFAWRLNGSFTVAIYDSRINELHLISDRMGSRQFFYVKGDDYLAFSSRIEAFVCMGIKEVDRINVKGLAEVLAFGRVLDENLWDCVEIVPSAHVVSYRMNNLVFKRYWDLAYHYADGFQNLSDNANDVAEAIRVSIEKRIGGWENIGLLLSGGLDSRTILGCLPKHATCYTLCDHVNLQTRIAARAAKIKGCKHILLTRTPNHYIQIAPESSRICEGAYNYIHAHSEGLIESVPIDTLILTGFFVDMFLKGYNLPLRSIKIGKKSLVLSRLDEMEGSALEAEMMRKLCVSAGGGVRSLGVLRKDIRSTLLEHPAIAVKRFIEDNTSTSTSTNDILDLAAIKQSFRHIHFPFILSIRHRLGERCMCFDNDLLNVVLAIPPEQRFDGRIFRKVLPLIDARLSRIVSANTLLPISVGRGIGQFGSILLWSCGNVARTTKRVLKRGTPWTHSTSSWQNMAEYWRSGTVSQYLKMLLNNDTAMRDDLFDIETVMNMIRLHENGKARYDQVLLMLISFLEWRKYQSGSFNKQESL